LRHGNLIFATSTLATVEDTLGSVHWDVDNCPVAMELNEPAAVEGHKRPALPEIVEGPLGRTPEQAHGVPAQLGRAPGRQAPPMPAFPGPATVWSMMRSNSFGSTER
jgi:hypothetical protein